MITSAGLVGCSKANAAEGMFVRFHICSFYSYLLGVQSEQGSSPLRAKE